MSGGIARAGLALLAAAIVFAAAALASLVMGPAEQGAIASPHRGATVIATPVAFDPSDPERTRFGALTYLGGVELQSEDPRFGGISDIAVDGEGRRFVAVSDIGDWITGTILYDGGVIAGIGDVVLAPLRGAQGEPMERKRDRDAEGLAPAGPEGIDGDLLVTFERRHRIARYPLAKHGVEARPDYVALPDGVADRLDLNRGLEAIGAFPDGAPMAGAIIAIAERLLDADGHHGGWLIGGPAPGAFALTRSDYFDITGLEVLDNGDVVVLERRYSPIRGPAMRLRLIDGAAIRPGAVLDGAVLMEAALPLTVDNMEGIAAHRTDDGTLVLTLVSDDNFRRVQRTLLLQFALPAPGRD